MNKPISLSIIDKTFSDGDTHHGLDLLRQYNLNNSSDAASWHRQAIIEEQIGDTSLAGEAHFKCIHIAPNNALGYLYAGYWLQKNKSSEIAAASLYSIAYDLDARILSLWNNSNVSEQTQERSREANNLLRNTLSQQHQTICSYFKGANRVADATWVQTHNQPIKFDQDHFSPELFFIPRLSKKPVFTSADLPWAEELNLQSKIINDELKHALNQQLGKNSLRPYLNDEHAHHSSLSDLSNSNNWMAIDLFKNGEANSKILSLFPKTLEALKKVPTYNLDQHPFEVFFSFLKPHQSIDAHYGQSNHSLTAHLSIEIPNDCYINIKHKNRTWKEGEVFAFDDSYLHSAHNQSNETRIVLIFSVWHPELNKNEQHAIKESFKARQTFLLERQGYLNQLTQR